MTKRRVTRPRTNGMKRPTRGRPPVHQETWSKVSVVLFDRQIVHLDRLTTDIRGTSGRVLNRADGRAQAAVRATPVHTPLLLKTLVVTGGVLAGFLAGYDTAVVDGDFVMVRLRTVSAAEPRWNKRVDVVLRRGERWSVVGIERE